MNHDSTATITHQIPIDGMTCHRCVATVTQHLFDVDGVVNVHVSLEPGQGTVETESQVSKILLEDAIRAAGFRVGTTDERPTNADQAKSVLATIGGPPVPAAAQPAHTSRAAERPHPQQAPGDAVARLDIRGMHCAACVARVEQQLLRLPETTAANCTLTPPRVTIFLRSETPVERLIEAVEEAGYEARPAGSLREALQPSELEGTHWRNRFAAAAAALIVILLASPLGGSEAAPWIQLIAATTALATTGRPFITGAIRQARRGGMNMDTLVAMSTTIAWMAGAAHVLSTWGGATPASHPMALMDGTMILCFISFGKWLEASTRTQATRSLQQLLQLAPTTATVVRSGTQLDVPAQEVQLGETIAIAAGQQIPLDATIIEGKSTIDESCLTGEAVPVVRQGGDSIWAGTMNGAGSLLAIVDQPADDSWVARIVDQVQQTLESKAPIQRIADKAASWFTPSVITLATISAATWWLVDGPGTAIRVLVTVLIVACPCALGLATPIAIVVATSRAAQQGVLFRTAEALEELGRVDTLLFDKTGTVTHGKLKVVKIVSQQLQTQRPTRGSKHREQSESDLQHRPSRETDWNDNELLRLAASVLQRSMHPAAQAVVAEATQRAIALSEVQDVQEHPGDGMQADFDGQRVLVGNRRWLEQQGVPMPEDPPSPAQIEISLGDQWLGSVALADEPRAEAREVIHKLNNLGLETVLLSGDARERVAATAEQVGIKQYQGEARPDEKLRVVHERQKQGRRIAMIGDGINDGPSLSAADVGIAMGEGADISVEAADVVLNRNSLHELLEACSLSRMTRRIIRQNLAWAVVYNAALIPWAAGWLTSWGTPTLPPAAAAAAMAMSSVTVVANSLRLRSTRA